MTSSVTDVLNFVQVSETLWSATLPAPHGSEPGPATDTSRLVGNHSWPFSLALPPECEVKTLGGARATHPLPASFSERMARVHIQYQLLVTVHRRRFRVDSTYVSTLPVLAPPPLVRVRSHGAHPLPRRQPGHRPGLLPDRPPGRAVHPTPDSIPRECPDPRTRRGPRRLEVARAATSSRLGLLHAHRRRDIYRACCPPVSTPLLTAHTDAPHPASQLALARPVRPLPPPRRDAAP